MLPAWKQLCGLLEENTGMSEDIDNSLSTSKIDAER